MTRHGRLAGKAALVTGSTHGIGRRTARVFAEESARVFATGRDAAAVQVLIDDAVAAFGTLDVVSTTPAPIVWSARSQVQLSLPGRVRY